MKNAQYIQTLVEFVASSSNKILSTGNGTDIVDPRYGSFVFATENVYEICGIVSCDSAATLKFTWGFSHNKNTVNPATGQQLQAGDDAAVFDNSQSFAIVANAPYQLLPFPALATHLKINVKSAADTANFRMYLRKVMML